MRDANSLAMAHKAGLPTLNFVKLKQDTKAEVEQALAGVSGGGSGGGGGAGGGSGSHRGGNVSARARQYTAGGGSTSSGVGVGGPVHGGGQGARHGGWAVPQQPGSSQGVRPQPNVGAAPARREFVKRQTSDVGGAVGGNMVPYPPPERANGSAGHAGGGGIPDRVQQEPTHPLTARNQPTQDSQSEKPAPAHRQPMTARPAATSDSQVPQKYDEVSKPSATGGSNVPLTPAAALKLYMKQMTLYEQGEILDYPQVYCVRVCVCVCVCVCV